MNQRQEMKCREVKSLAQIAIPCLPISRRGKGVWSR